ncbi:MAG: hypothetical protein ACKVOK_12020 [Flavobacteriales bacterium]
MSTQKNLGIWMDHSRANLMDGNIEGKDRIVIESEFTHQSKESTLQKNENVMHNKENHQQSEYYKKIGAEILNYDHVLIFGPTDAKSELRNLLRSDHRFAQIRIEVMASDHLSDNQQYAKVREHFGISN